jgi:hypothetical protein
MSEIDNIQSRIIHSPSFESDLRSDSSAPNEGNHLEIPEEFSTLLI